MKSFVKKVKKVLFLVVTVAAVFAGTTTAEVSEGFTGSFGMTKGDTVTETPVEEISVAKNRTTVTEPTEIKESEGKASDAGYCCYLLF